MYPFADSSPPNSQDHDRIPDNVKTFILSTLANQSEERIQHVKRYQMKVLLKYEDREKLINGPRLPYELIGNIAQHLQDDTENKGLSYHLRSLAALNRVSKAVHAITLPYLYHRIVYTRCASFANAVLSKPIPTGWKYVKYLCLNDHVFDLLEQYRSAQSAPTLLELEMYNDIVSPLMAYIAESLRKDLKLALKRLPNGELYVALTDDFVTPSLITRHLKAIADTYSENWSYHDSRRDDRFVEIRGRCSVPAGLTWDLGFGAENIQLETEGVLTPGQDDGNVKGFDARVSTATYFLARDDYDDDDRTDVFIKAYPCDHVPVPANW